MHQTKNTKTLFLIPTELAEGTGSQILGQQVLDLCQQLDYFLVENIRTARRFLSSLKFGLTIEDLQFEELSKNTADSDIPKLLQPLLSGKDVGLMSEAGCPGIADPGARAVAWAHRNGIRVVPLIGPSSIVLTLMGSGFNGQQFSFHGYLPIKGPERKRALQQLEKAAQQGATQLFMETPYRNNQLLKDLLASCQPNTLLCIGANLTSPNAFLQTKTIKDWKLQLPDLHKIPAVFAFGR